MIPSNDRNAKLIAADIKAKLEKGISRGLNAAGFFIVGEVKKVLSVPAPRKKRHDSGGNVYYVAATRATPGAPPRKLTGRLRASVIHKTEIEPGVGNKKSTYSLIIGVNARSPKGFNYPKYHERKGLGKRSGEHPYLAITIKKYEKKIVDVIHKEIHKAFE